MRFVYFIWYFNIYICKPINTCRYNLTETCVSAAKCPSVRPRLEGEMPKNVSFGRNVHVYGANHTWAKRPGGESSRGRNVQEAKRPGMGRNGKGAKRPVTIHILCIWYGTVLANTQFYVSVYHSFASTWHPWWVLLQDSRLQIVVFIVECSFIHFLCSR